MDEPDIKLVPPEDRRFTERILLIGTGGVGKTTAIGTFAAMVPDAKFWVADTDISFAYERLIDTEVPFTRDQWDINELTSWADWITFTSKVMEQGDPTKDFLVVDSHTWLWDEVQSDFSDKVHGVDVDEFLTDLRKNTEGDRAAFMAASGQKMNWDLINKTYKRKVNVPLHGWRGHVVLCVEGEAMTRQDGNNEALSEYAPWGVKPRGQKGNHFIMRTNLIMKKDTTRRPARYKVWTVKDQGREDMDGALVPDVDDGGFAQMYLMDYAGWKAVRR